MDSKSKAEGENDLNEVVLGGNCIVFELDFENYLLEVSLPCSIKLALPVGTAIKNSQYLRCYYEAASKKSSNANKKIRCDFPQDLLKEFEFLNSPVSKDKEETVRTLLDPSSGKNEVDEILAAITAVEE